MSPSVTTLWALAMSTILALPGAAGAAPGSEGAPRQQMERAFATTRPPPAEGGTAFAQATRRKRRRAKKKPQPEQTQQAQGGEQVTGGPGEDVSGEHPPQASPPAARQPPPPAAKQAPRPLPMPPPPAVKQPTPLEMPPPPAVKQPPPPVQQAPAAPPSTGRGEESREPARWPRFRLGVGLAPGAMLGLPNTLAGGTVRLRAALGLTPWLEVGLAGGGGEWARTGALVENRPGYSMLATLEGELLVRARLGAPFVEGGVGVRTFTVPADRRGYLADVQPLMASLGAGYTLSVGALPLDAMLRVAALPGPRTVYAAEAQAVLWVF